MALKYLPLFVILFISISLFSFMWYYFHGYSPHYTSVFILINFIRFPRIFVNINLVFCFHGYCYGYFSRGTALKTRHLSCVVHSTCSFFFFYSVSSCALFPHHFIHSIFILTNIFAPMNSKCNLTLTNFNSVLKIWIFFTFLNNFVWNLYMTNRDYLLTRWASMGTCCPFHRMIFV